MELTYRNKKKEKEILEIINKKYKEVENNKLSFITENSFYINEDNFYAMIKLLKNPVLPSLRELSVAIV